jgi:predicted nucleic acid-binding protein
MTAVLDSGALIALERGDRRMAALAVVITRDEVPTFVPAGVVAQVWRGSARQHDIARLLATRAVRVEPLDDELARAVGILVGAAGASDVVDGHVALLARRTRATVYTSDENDIHRIDPTLNIVAVQPSP